MVLTKSLVLKIRLCLCSWDQIHLEVGSVWRTSVMSVSSGLCSPDSLGWEALSCFCHPGPYVCAPNHLLQLSLVCLPGFLPLLLFLYPYDPATGQGTLRTLCWISFCSNSNNCIPTSYLLLCSVCHSDLHRWPLSWICPQIPVPALL